MNLFKKIFIPNGQKESIIAYETWVVRWISRHDKYGVHIQEECEVFTKKEDAEKFAEQLREAFNLIRDSVGIKVKVYKN